jgi:hypothetical protein
MRTRRFYSDDDCDISAAGDLRKLRLLGRWRESIARLASEYEIDALLASENMGWISEDLDFLAQLPPLRWLSVAAREPIDWKQIQEGPFD